MKTNNISKLLGLVCLAMTVLCAYKAYSISGFAMNGASMWAFVFAFASISLLLLPSKEVVQGLRYFLGVDLIEEDLKERKAEKSKAKRRRNVSGTGF